MKAKYDMLMQHCHLEVICIMTHWTHLLMLAQVVSALHHSTLWLPSTLASICKCRHSHHKHNWRFPPHYKLKPSCSKLHTHTHNHKSYFLLYTLHQTVTINYFLLPPPDDKNHHITMTKTVGECHLIVTHLSMSSELSA